MKTRKTYFLNLTLLGFALLVFIGCKQVPNEPAMED